MSLEVYVSLADIAFDPEYSLDKMTEDEEVATIENFSDSIQPVVRCATAKLGVHDKGIDIVFQHLSQLPTSPACGAVDE